MQRTITTLRELYWSEDQQQHMRIYSLLFQLCGVCLSGGVLALGFGIYGYGWWLLVLGAVLLLIGVVAFRRLYRSEKEWIARNE